MVIITDRAEAHLDSLVRHFRLLERDLTIIRMVKAVKIAVTKIDNQTGPFFSAPRPYPGLKQLGWRWLKVERYWIAFSDTTGGYAVNAVFHDSADIPGRL